MTPTQAAKAHGVRNYGVFWFTAMSKASQKQLIKAYVAGFRAGKNGGKSHARISQ